MQYLILSPKIGEFIEIAQVPLAEPGQCHLNNVRARLFSTWEMRGQDAGILVAAAIRG
jgi:hypothetical protein